MAEKSHGEELSELVGSSLDVIRDEFISVAEMQRHIMPDPDRLKAFGDYDIFGMTIPTAVVGGDFYHFIDLEGRFGLKDRMGISIADASGHGLVAAMLIRDFNTALLIGIAFQCHYEQDTTSLLVTKMNRRMYRSSQDNQYISAFFGELHRQGLLRYINAGHYNPLLFKKEERVALDVGGAVLGAFRNPPKGYEVGEVHMEEEDVLICYTDGIVEAFDGQQEYGVDRLIQVVDDNRTKGSREIFNTVIEDVERFSGPAGQHDDRTLMVIRRGTSDEGG